MHKKLAMLCEQQLNAILVESDVTFNKIINSATTSMRLSNQAQAGSKNGELTTEMQKLLVCLQFHDEFSQRLNHVIELCRLLAEQKELGDEAAEVDPQLLERVAEIFSVSAEFSVLQKIFPEYQHESTDAAIELF
ncbi:MAG: hypothetical protein V4603_08205 [Pseudomonadota bacterium]